MDTIRKRKYFFGTLLRSIISEIKDTIRTPMIIGTITTVNKVAT